LPLENPEVCHSVFAPQFRPYADPRNQRRWRIRPGNSRVFFTGENFEPDMEGWEHAMTFIAGRSPQSFAASVVGL
jgi:hypothetical protein